MITVGDVNEFAIQCEFTEAVGDWLFGHLRFVFFNTCCGDWEDSTDLRGSVSWLRDFAQNPCNRSQPDLLRFSVEGVFDRIVKPELAEGVEFMGADYPDAYHRFHISHLAMSAFNLATMVLVEDETRQRCLWTMGGDPNIHDFIFQKGRMQKVAGEFCSALAEEVRPLGHRL